jgi:hypothetical protein
MVDVTQKIVNEFVSYYTENNEKSSLDDMRKKLTEIYKSNSKNTKKPKNDDTKKEPSLYNNFMKEKMQELKETVPDAKERMKKVAELWGKQKKDGKPEEEPEVEEVNKEEEEPEIEAPPPEVKPEVKKKKSSK